MTTAPDTAGCPITGNAARPASEPDGVREGSNGPAGVLPPNPTVGEVRKIAGSQPNPATGRDQRWLTRASIPALSAAVRGLGRPTLLPPGPVGAPVVGSLRQMRREPFEFFRRSAQEYGDIYRVPTPLGNFVVVNHPDYVSQVMDDPHGRYSMIGPVSFATAIVGAAIPMLEGDKFKQRRRMLMPMFGRRHLARVAETISDEFLTRIECLSVHTDTGHTLDLQHEIAQITLPAFLRAMFSSSISAREIETTDEDLRTFMSLMASPIMLSPVPRVIGLPGQGSAIGSMHRLWKLTRRLVKDRRNNPVDTPDLLSLLLDARYDDGSPLSERDLSMELMILMAGGYETVVASLSWTLALLLSHPEHLSRLYDEIDALDGAVPTPADLPRLPWARACFDEGQRLQGHPLNPRFAIDDDVIGGHLIPRYSIVGPSVYSIHRDPRWWPDPDRYDPNRFIDEKLVRSRPRLAFLPFGSGPHHCIGTGMAYMNAQFLLTLIFQRYRLALKPGWTPEHHFNFSVTVKGGVPVELHRRRQEALCC